MPKKRSAMPPVSGRERCEMGIQRSSANLPFNPNELIIRGTAIKMPGTSEYVPKNPEELIIQGTAIPMPMSSGSLSINPNELIIRGTAIKMPMSSGNLSTNPNELIIRGTAIKPPPDFILEKQRSEVREFDPITGRSLITVPLVPQNSAATVTQSSTNLPSYSGPLPRKSLSLSKEQRHMQQDRDHEASKAHAKEVFLRYSLPVHIGQWHNMACVHEQYFNDVAYRVSKGLTFNQQKQQVAEYLHEKMELSAYNNCLQYEMCVQIETDMQYVMSNGTDQISSRLLLSTIVSENAIIENREPYIIESGSLVTLSHHHCRIRRNVFCFAKCPLEQKPEKSTVLHYENLYIRLFCRGSRKPLYLRCETLNTETLGHNRERMLLTVSETVDKYCEFQIHSLLEFNRRFQVREEVHTFTKILICHTMTRRYLSVDERLFQGSLIVGKELKACCFTSKDCNNRLTAKNYWIVKTREVDED